MLIGLVLVCLFIWICFVGWFVLVWFGLGFDCVGLVAVPWSVDRLVGWVVLVPCFSFWFVGWVVRVGVGSGVGFVLRGLCVLCLCACFLCGLGSSVGFRWSVVWFLLV